MEDENSECQWQGLRQPWQRWVAEAVAKSLEADEAATFRVEVLNRPLDTERAREQWRQLRDSDG